MSQAIARVPEAEDPPPAPILVEAMAAHLFWEHNRDLDLKRDVSFVGNRVAEPIMYWRNEAGLSYAAFWCRLCPDEEGYIPPSRRKLLADRGRMYLLDEFPPSDPDRISYLKLHHPGLRGLLAATPPGRHDEMAEAYDRGELGPALLKVVEASRPRDEAVEHRPDYLRRRGRFCRWFLSVYGEEGSVERAIKRFNRLHETDCDAYRKILGTKHLYSEETFREYVYIGTTKDERDQAKAGGTNG